MLLTESNDKSYRRNMDGLKQYEKGIGDSLRSFDDLESSAEVVDTEFKTALIGS